MEFKIKKKEFVEGLSRIQGVVERKSTMAILSNVLLEADSHGLKISATDLEIAASNTLPAQTINGGRITILLKSLLDIVREAEKEEIRFALGENNRVELSSGGAIFKIPGLSAQEFPTFPLVDEEPMVLPCGVIKGMFEKTEYAMANDETRYNLNGVLLQKRGGDTLRMVATDGHRLAQVDREVNLGPGKGDSSKGDSPNDFSVIIPRKGVGELTKMLSQEGEFELAIGEKGLVAKRSNETLYIRYLDGEYPDYTAVIPQDNNVFVSIPKGALVGGLRRVSLVANEKSHGVVLSFTSGHLEFLAVNPDLGEAREEILIDYKGKKLTIGFNARYLLDVLDVIQDEKVVIALKGETNACLLKSEYDRGFLAVIMPMRI